MKKTQRSLAMLLVVCMVFTLLPASAFAAHDSTGKPIDLNGPVYLALYIGENFPGEPAEHSVSDYQNYNGSFEKLNGYVGTFADSANGILKTQILDDVVQGTSGVWGVFSTTGGSRYLLESSGLVDSEGRHNAETERTIILNAGREGITEENVDDYTIIWYVVKYQKSDASWHIDGLITKKQTYSVNYYGNGNTAGGAPSGVTDLEAGTRYTIEAKPANLVKRVDRDTYIFNGWNTKEDGTGTHYEPGQVVEINSDLVLYAEWYMANKYSATVVTNLDGEPANVENILGENVTVYMSSDGEDFIELPKTQTGTYMETVTDNGTYQVYFKNEAGEFEEVHGHQIIIYNQNGRTELHNYSVLYDTAGGNWAAGEDPGSAHYHSGTPVTATTAVPSREGYIFTGWQDQNGNAIAPGGQITEGISEKTVLTAQWEETIDVTVHITMNHKAEDGSVDNSRNKHDMLLQMLVVQNGVNLPLESVQLDETKAVTSDGETTTYTYTLTDVPQGRYHASSAKSHYTTTQTHTGEIYEDQDIYLTLNYTPDDFDLDFDVIVNFTGQTKEMLPKAVNVKITCWSYDENGVLGWHTIFQHAGTLPPSTVRIDPETGRGSGLYPVWKYWADSDEPYAYRVEVTSFVMPDGTILPAAPSADGITYLPDGSGLYTAVVTNEPDGITGGQGAVPTYPAGSNTDLTGTYYDIDYRHQNGTPTVTVDIHSYQVTFDAQGGTVEGQDVLILENQFLYPELYSKLPTHSDEDYTFSGWFLDPACTLPAENRAGAYLTGNVTYYAKWSTPFTIQGMVTVTATYMQDTNVTINEQDRAKESLVVLQRKLPNGSFNDVAGEIVRFTYPDGSDTATAAYSFEKVPQDGAEYRIQVLELNYTSTYDNEIDPEPDSYTGEEFVALAGDDDIAQVNVHLQLDPETFPLMMEVDASALAEGFRPNDSLVEVLYRDLGNNGQYTRIAQHDTDPYGTYILVGSNGVGSGGYHVWKWHTNGTLYQYQMNITRLYGSVPGVFDATGTEFNSDTAPYVIEYSDPVRWDNATNSATRWLRAKLIPKEYHILFDLNAPEEELGAIQGMQDFVTDDGRGGTFLSASHTWGFADTLRAYPYRPGYVFKGWTYESNAGIHTSMGDISVAGALAESVTLTAQWEPVEDPAYVVRYLELNTEKVLQGSKVYNNARVGAVIAARDEAVAILGYKYVGATIGGQYQDDEQNPTLTVVENAANLITLYYLSDGSDGFTDQVESNLHLDKTATLENNGTYTVWLDTFTRDNPVTTMIQQNTPLDIVMVIDQSGSIIKEGYLDELQTALNSFVVAIANHGRINEVDHRIAVVGYAGDADEPPTGTNTNDYPIAGGNTSEWVNTGVFDSKGDFYPYPTTGFVYSQYHGAPLADGDYYVFNNGEYLRLRHHDSYYHLISEEDARIEDLEGVQVYGYVYDDPNDYHSGRFVPLTRNLSGMWIYERDGAKLSYSWKEFFTYHEDVWTHRQGIEPRQIHAYGTGSSYTCTDGHSGLFTRTSTTGRNPQVNIYKDALIPVSVGANGSGGVNPGLLASTQHLASNGGTYVQYGIEMANKIFAQHDTEAEQDRVRVMVMFTDGMPGIGTFDNATANEAIAEAYITKNTYNAYSYTIGLYHSQGVDEHSDQAVYMNALSSNYPEAKSMEDVIYGGYTQLENGTVLDSNATYYVLQDGNYLPLKYGYVRVGWRWQNCWYYQTSGWLTTTNNSISTTKNPTVTNGQVGGQTVYAYLDSQYRPTEHSGYYQTTDSADQLNDYFNNVMKEITTKITTEIILHEDTILRDIMGQGLVLTEDTVITAYTQEGVYNNTTGQVDWAVDGNGDPELVTMATLELKTGQTSVTGKEGVSIQVFNLDAENATDPNEQDYHPHTVDITGYDFSNWYINESHPNGYRLMVQITRIEGREDVEWGRSTLTNNPESGLWLPKNAQGERVLLLPFDQPSTIFVERAYVLDYAKEFTLTGWYYDSEGDKQASAIHLDNIFSDGMTWFDETLPQNKLTATKYGTVELKDGVVTYTPTTMRWGAYDQFYVFGNTWRNTVVSQDANQNGNLWSKVNVIPANSVYYEDSFVTTDNGDGTGVDGFTFTGSWETVFGNGGEAAADQNTETPEHLENPPYGDVHGWIDSMDDDGDFSDGSAHATGINKERGAGVQFTFTGTGVDVYTRTNSKSGLIMATLYQVKEENGEETLVRQSGFIMDNLAVSGDYYHIPTVSFRNLKYGTYCVKLLASSAKAEEDYPTDDGKRYEYYLDGIRVYNPLDSDQTYADETVKDAYGKELNAVFTEVRDILLDYNDFNIDQTDGTDGKTGAVFIDWIRDGQQSGNDAVDDGTPSYEIGTFREYGPKNEVYMTQGQSIVLKVDPANTYYVGLKSLNGVPVTVAVSGIDSQEPVQIQLSHSTDMFYQVTPVDGYIVIMNDSEATTEGEKAPIVSVTQLRATSLKGVPANGGVLKVESSEAVEAVQTFFLRMNRQEEEVPETTEPEVTEPETTEPEATEPEATEPEATEPPAEEPGDREEMLKYKKFISRLFGSIRSWLKIGG